MMAMRDGVGRAIGFVKILRDSSVERRSKLALEESRQQLLAALEETERARAASGTLIIRLTTERMNEGSTRGRPIPSTPEPRSSVSEWSPVRK